MPKDLIAIDGFTIIKKLGTGARSIIYLATDEENRQTVALKRAFMETPEDIRIFEQMENEFRISRQVEHHYLRKCFKIIKKRKLLRTQELLMSMEYFDGVSLEDSPGLSLGDILLVFRMVATALNAMHQKGYVHCDIKPNNILFSRKGSIKVIDLGQSCRIGEIKKRIQGTPDYIAPEQVRREHLSHRTDIFNLGATMYWALTGKNVPTLIPKANEYGFSMPGTMECKSPQEIYKKIPASLSKLVMDCVKERQADRPSNMAEIIERLDIMIRDIFGNRLQNNASASQTTVQQGG